MKGGEPLTMREASFISSLMGHAQHIDAATVRFTMHIDGSLDGQINLKSEYTRELERAERERAGTCASRRARRRACGSVVRSRGCTAACRQPHNPAGQARPAQGCAPRRQERALRARRRCAAAAFALLVA